MNQQNLLQFILNPKFLRKIDRYLLLNRPFLWSTRVHYVLYYGLLINIISILLTFILIQPDQIDELTQFIVFFLFLFEIFTFFFWLFRQSIFNLEQDYGEQRHFFRRSFLEIIIYAFCIFIIFSPSLIVPIPAIYKIANKIEINENTFCDDSKFFQQLTTPSDAKSKNIISRTEKALKICSDIQYFVTGVDLIYRDEESEILPFDIYPFLQTFFISTIGLPVLIIQKYSSWRVLTLTGLYSGILAAFITPILIIFDTLNIELLDLSFGKISFYGINRNFFVIILILAFFIFFQSVRIFKRNSYSLILVVHHGMITILLNLLLFLILIAHKDYKHLTHFLPCFLYFLVIYSCLFPFQKKMLLRNFSLPKSS
ncbi:MAG: hypothetical protein QNJ55_04975 [Xenococcus sp. MO_188.B8]|nr:hypothetical protein [Xenococcus sp. MO_188.B8]